MKKKLFSFAMALAVLVGLCVGIPSAAEAVSTDYAWGEGSWAISGQPETGLILFKDQTINGYRYGLKDANGTVVLAAVYWMVKYAGGDRIIAGREGEGVGIITTSGTVIYPYTVTKLNVRNEEEPVFQIAEMPYEAASWMNLIYGLYDWNGKELLPIQYDTLRYYTTGDGAGTFSPNKNCTNARILTFLWRAYGQPEPSIANPFTNTIPESYAKAAVWAYAQAVAWAAIAHDRSVKRRLRRFTAELYSFSTASTISLI